MLTEAVASIEVTVASWLALDRCSGFQQLRQDGGVGGDVGGGDGSIGVCFDWMQVEERRQVETVEPVEPVHVAAPALTAVSGSM